MTFEKKIRIGWMVVLGSLLVAVAPMVACAEEDGYVGDKGMSFGFRGSSFDPEDADDTVGMGGAQLRFFLGRALAIEGSIDYRREEFGSTKVHVFPVQASLMAFLVARKPVSLFLLAGPGWYYTQIDPAGGAEDETDHRFGAHAGGGLLFTLNEYWSIDASYRHIWLEDFTSKDASLQNKDFSDSGDQITAGINYHF